jgi:hypothetical protein
MKGIAGLPLISAGTALPAALVTVGIAIIPVIS